MSFNDLMQKFSSPGEVSEEFELQPSPAGNLETFINRFTGMTDESFWFYNNTVQLKFSVSDHIYYLVDPVLGNLTEVDGVTNTCHIINASEMLVPWSAKVAIAKLLRLIPTETVDGILRIKAIPFDEFTTIALEAKSAHKDKLDEASDIGHVAHKCLEDSIRHAMEYDPDKIVRQLINLPSDERASNAAGGAKSWMDQHNVRWQETETKIYSKEHNYAGTMDGLAVCDSCQDRSCCVEEFKDRLSLIDWKSSNYLKINYLFQTASYQNAKQEELGIEIVDRWILRLGKNEEEAGKFEPWHMGPLDFKEDLAGFLACLSLTRLVDSVEERMKGQKKNIKAVKKEMKEAAKLIAKEQEKLKKALEKAEAKKKKEEEKVKIKAEAKARREAEKKEKTCTSTNLPTCGTPDTSGTKLVTSIPTDDSLLNQSTKLENTPQPELASLTEETQNLKYEKTQEYKPIELPGEK